MAALIGSWRQQVSEKIDPQYWLSLQRSNLEIDYVVLVTMAFGSGSCVATLTSA